MLFRLVLAVAAVAMLSQLWMLFGPGPASPPGGTAGPGMVQTK